MTFWIGPEFQAPVKRHAPAVVADRLLAVLMPHQVGLGQRDGRRGVHLGEPVVEEVHVLEDVIQLHGPMDVDAEPRRTAGELLGKLERLDHVGASSSIPSGRRRAMFAATSSKCRSSAATTASVSRASSACRIGVCRSADHCGSAPGTTSVM